jgi:hypothetical protein
MFSQDANVTASVLITGTLIHLTKGTGFKRTSKALAPGHNLCPKPMTNSLPPGWHYCRHEKSIITDRGILVPVVDDPAIGTPEGQAALKVLRAWEQKNRARGAVA